MEVRMLSGMRLPKTLRLLAFAGLCSALLAACASTGDRGSAGTGDRTMLTHEQLNDRSFNNLYHAVETLRPRWLRRPGGETSGPVTVILNNTRMGSVDALRSLETQAVQFVQFYDATSAAARVGRDTGQGLILGTTKR
jgi:hypothetical protein